MAEPQNVDLEAEADNYENDSALGAESIASSTTSINSSIMKYREENGRTYHAYKDGKYQYPNDETENDRLDLQHHLFSLTFDGRLFTAPMPKEKRLHGVLDIDTGTGIWAIDFADEHPETKVLGVDLSPSQPSFTPPNFAFCYGWPEIDDLEESWTFSEKFDLIYSRMMIGSVADFPRLYRQYFDNLSNGGWIETKAQRGDAKRTEVDEYRQCRNFYPMSYMGWRKTVSHSIQERSHRLARSYQIKLGGLGDSADCPVVIDDDDDIRDTATHAIYQVPERSSPPSPISPSSSRSSPSPLSAALLHPRRRLLYHHLTSRCAVHLATVRAMTGYMWA
ncbi:S-adenosyl-L-methionine-dependent methyltransferase [Leptodontidium sp. 2 PMI_412]|nr:S-adenosyl-L-methionine-dependent methyltransferase [Leptodontidium sp. 2 PMI_412]